MMHRDVYWMLDWPATLIALLLVWIMVSCTSAWAGDLPDPLLTPGAMSADVVRDVTLDDLCPHANTDAVRNVPERIKAAVFAEYGLHQEHRPDCTGPGHACFEIDHDCSLELGCNNDIKNLWPQAYDGGEWNAHVKDRLENELHRRVCNGAMPLHDAQTCISTDWIACYKNVLGDHDADH